MGDNDQTTGLSADPAANAPDAAAAEKGKGKAVDYTPAEEATMEEDEYESSEEEEDLVAEDEDEEEHDNLEPISTDNIIDGGRRTRGKRIDFAEAAEKAKAAGEDELYDDDEDDEDFVVGEEDEMHE
ncbi:hypothetical protein VTN77DRAFT_3313 [Rasamsonia byssochlamydoides]|uniref:uncharacterized protein n=1 Tax=Rasamsonia byssochlamydoides TaxID=89139 RepID=UPI00374484C3